MIFSAAVIILVGAIAYFHYVQGFFSATLSAILAIIAAVLAVSYHETVVMALLRGKVADQAHALMLVALFVGIYTLLRVIFDKIIPGNLRLPVIVEKIGAGAMGVVAGLFAVGIIAIAAQELPFGPSIAGYTRYDVSDTRAAQVRGARSMQDIEVYDELKADTLDPSQSSRLIIPVDDLVVNLTARLSDNGSLATTPARPLAAVHPALLDELFMQRLGIQTGAKHVAYNLASDQQVMLKGLYKLDAVVQADAEEASIRPAKNPPPLKPDPASQMLLVIRLQFSRNATDADNFLRVSTAAVRLVANGKNYIPLGTMQFEEGPILRVNKPDDFLIVPGDGMVDFAYLVDLQDVVSEDGGAASNAKRGTPQAQGPATLTVNPGVFIEAKRLGILDLTNQTISREPLPPLDPKTTVMRKPDLPRPKGTPGAGGTAGAAVSDAPIDFEKVDFSPALFTEINPGPHEDNGTVTSESVTGTLKEGKFSKLTVNLTRTITMLAQGERTVRELYAPPAMKVVQIVAHARSRGGDAWQWADRIGDFDLVDGNGNALKPRGAWARVKQGTSDRMVASYDADAPISNIERGEGRPTDVWIAFVVPEGAMLKELRFAGKRIKTLDQPVP